MTYASLMVNLESAGVNATALQLAGDLAERFHARVIGVAVRQPLQMVYADGYVDGALMDQDRLNIAKDLTTTEATFRIALQDRASGIEWRSSVCLGSSPDYLADQARCADLVITSLPADAAIDAPRSVNIGDLVLRAGRPVLVVPSTARPLKLERMLVAWKDTREARRAVADALPLLQIATQVSLVEVVAEDALAAARERLADLASWLHCHGVIADGLALASTGDDAARLDAIAREQGTDLVIAGAYGHNRVREWAFGGVTRSLLIDARRCALVSH